MLKTIFRGIKYGLSGNTLIIVFEWIIRSLHDLSPLVFSVIWAYLIDTAIKGIQDNNLTFHLMVIPFILYGVIEVTKSFFQRLSDYLQNRVFDKLEVKVHTDFIGKYSSLDIQSIEDPEVNRMFQVVKGPYEWRIRGLVFTVGGLVSAFILIAASAAILIDIYPVLLLIIIVSSIPSLVINMKYGSIGWGIWRADASKQRKFELTREFLTNRQNLIEASINNIAPHLIGVIRDILQNYHKKRMPMLKNRAGMMFLADLIRVMGSLVSVYLLIQSTLNGSVSVGNLILGASIFISIAGSFNQFLYELTEIYNAGLFIEDFMSFLNLKPKVKPGSMKLEKLARPPRIEFQNVSFKYPKTQRLILKDIDLVIEPGMKVALVGENGVGKTTLIKVLARFYDLDNGKILINGVDLSSIETESWEQNLGLLTQHFNTYPAFTVEENIAFGDISKGITRKEIESAAEKARVTAFIQKYPKDYEQLLSVQFDDGIDPSWGQWQRIGIARTFYRNSPIIILDEPTSAIDAQAEYEIFQNINKHTEGKTVIYVSHRYSTVRNADLICVLKDGTIAESGTHAGLLKFGGEYAKNFALQALGYS